MCGILGLISTEDQNLDQGKFFTALSQAKHRGPDGTDMQQITDQCLFGFNWLSIQDLHPKAMQPFHYMGNWLVFNGEIYNFIELRQELETKGYKFETHSDTEVLAAGLTEKGEEFLEDINGIFAFCFYNSKKKEFIVARDRVGIKPLFYYSSMDTFIFASEISSILEYVPAKLDHSMLHTYMFLDRFVGSQKAKSFFKNIQSLEPGYFFIINAEGTIKSKNIYYHPNFRTSHNEPLEEIEKEFSELADCAVAWETRSDVPIGMVLSGGIDSTFITTFTTPYLVGKEKRIPTFTYYYEKRGEKTDFEYTQKVLEVLSKQYGDVYEIHALNLDDPFTLHDFMEAARAREEPVMDIRYISKVKIYKSVQAAGLKVCFNGQGADEVFYGYYPLDYWMSIFYREGVFNTANIISYFKKLNALKLSGLNKDFIDKALNASEEYIDNVFTVIGKQENQQKLVTAFIRENMLPTMLMQEDKFGMHSGVEVRVPTVNRLLVEFADLCDYKVHIASTTSGRHLFRKMLEKKLPEEIVYRKKSPGPKKKHYTDELFAIIQEHKSDMKSSPLLQKMYKPDFIETLLNDEETRSQTDTFVSRELNKPCIIGTRISTHVLKTGDVVTVDAANGIINIIESSSSSNILPEINNVKKEDYALTFWARGLSVLFTDVSKDMFTKFNALYTLVDGVYYQYFQKDKIQQSEEEGKKIYNDSKKVSAYKKRLNVLCAKLNNFNEKVIKRKKVFTKNDIEYFLNKSLEFVREYSYMNVEYTEKAFEQSKKSQSTAHALEGIMKYKDEIRDILNVIYFDKENYLLLLLQKLSIQFTVPASDLEYYIQPELIQLFKNKKVAKKLIQERKKEFAAQIIDGVSYYYTGDEARAIQKLLENKVESTEQVTGQIANRGKITGKVKIIPVDYSDFARINREIAQMEQGDILVAETTAPELIVACKKAGAIVTDMGGMMSHAAIVSRELGIPCVVGTKNASRVFKDGDIVEVDADNGIVKVLETNNTAVAINPDFWEFEFQQRNNQPVLMADFWNRALRDNLPKDLKFNINFDYLFTTYSKGYVKKFQKAAVLNYISDAIKKDDRYVKYVYQGTIKAVNEFEKFAKTLEARSRKKNSRKELLKLWKIFDKELIKLIPWFWVPWYLTEENYLSDRVKTGLEKHRAGIENITDFNNALLILLFPVKQTMFQQEQSAYFSLLEYAQNRKNFETDKVFLKKSQEYLTKYSWTTTYFILPLEKLDQKTLVIKIKKDIKEKLFEQHRLQEHAQKESEKLKSVLQNQLIHDKQLQKDIRLAQDYAWLLTWSIEQALVSTARLIPFYKLTAAEIGVPYKKLVLYTSDEIEQLLAGTINLSQINVDDRELAYAILLENSNTQLIVGEKALELSDFVEENVGKVDQSLQEFSGQATYPGVVKGRVFIALTAQEAGNLQEGDILVTSMTTPDYIPAMKKAAAVVTNEGGLLSHAAIISRELQRPCIVGTKIATKLLKNGDLVEVDANKGIVKILK